MCSPSCHLILLTHIRTKTFLSQLQMSRLNLNLFHIGFNLQSSMTCAYGNIWFELSCSFPDVLPTLDVNPLWAVILTFTYLSLDEFLFQWKAYGFHHCTWENSLATDFSLFALFVWNKNLCSFPFDFHLHSPWKQPPPLFQPANVGGGNAPLLSSSTCQHAQLAATR